MRNSWLFSPDGKGITLSVGLHLFVLGLAYFIQRTPVPGISSGQAYRIALQPTSAYTAANHHQPEHVPQASIQTVRSAVTQADKPSKNRFKKKPLRPPQRRRKQMGGAPQKKSQPDQAPKIDERGLYHSGQNRGKQAGATLELRGWEWDTLPDPKDTTEEFGKIVFEIKVDEDGEIISIQTMEKTVTPMVEKIYIDALRALTFSKTAETPSGISTGKVTFVIVAK
ncbi:MAG: cell envelope integrity protein TolA [Candidatus Cardinium sp.]|uniref:cell envelope integrity protein TolA n=1 Tax=Candidatus Cardinium sp. TP TaxID=2961955 RepID=UPI0021AFE119|nr:cell envelope integrity protein TolA [Candidatus Cardinium sp. TP]MCT4696855.1 hypothetical protein [Candidatus Cardinium sp. TP]MDN5246680.1 cell envelope integrity protein TolA [Candidatus Cardinium sp.]